MNKLEFSLEEIISGKELITYENMNLEQIKKLVQELFNQLAFVTVIDKTGEDYEGKVDGIGNNELILVSENIEYRIKLENIHSIVIENN